MCSAIWSGVDDPTYVTFFKKSAPRTFAYFCFFCVSKNPLYGFLRAFVSFVFQKAPSTDFCLLLSLLCFKKPPLRTFVYFCLFCVSKNRSTNFCVLLSLLCFKKPPLRTFVYFCHFCVSKNRSTGFYDVLHDMVGRGRPDVQCLSLKSCV